MDVFSKLRTERFEEDSEDHLRSLFPGVIEQYQLKELREAVRNAEGGCTAGRENCGSLSHSGIGGVMSDLTCDASYGAARDSTNSRYGTCEVGSTTERCPLLTEDEKPDAGVLIAFFPRVFKKGGRPNIPAGDILRQRHRRKTARLRLQRRGN